MSIWRSSSGVSLPWTMRSPGNQVGGLARRTQHATAEALPRHSPRPWPQPGTCMPRRVARCRSRRNFATPWSWHRRRHQIRVGSGARGEASQDTPGRLPRYPGPADLGTGNPHQPFRPGVARRRFPHHQPGARRQVPVTCTRGTFYGDPAARGSGCRRRAIIIYELAHRARALKMTLKARPAAEPPDNAARVHASGGSGCRSAEVVSEWQRWSCT